MSLWVESSLVSDLLQHEQDYATRSMEDPAPLALGGTAQTRSSRRGCVLLLLLLHLGLCVIQPCSADCLQDVRVHHLNIVVCLVVVMLDVAVEDADFRLVFVGVDGILLVLYSVRFVRLVANPLVPQAIIQPAVVPLHRCKLGGTTSRN